MTDDSKPRFNTEQRRRIDEIAAAAMERKPTDLVAFVRERAAGDELVAQEAISLIRRAWAEEETIAPDHSPGAAPHGHERIPEIPGYRILHRLGRGGMGSVYAAVKIDAHARPIVAIKVVRRGVDTEDVLRRFETERQVLGALDHPNIARFYDAGESDDGLPYFAMELVEGMPIDTYCDSNGLSIRARLELFKKVCSAVHHAHTNLVVHRDLKPSNIIVNASGEPKLLDFGIAKLLNPQLVRAVGITGPGVRIMTPEYASPEQVRGQPVTTLSDVYSLGVLLYELLSGHRPYNIPSRLEDEIRRIVCDTDPERPSTAVRRVEERRRSDGTTETITPDAVAKRRDERFPTLRRRLAGDLDDIVMQAMAKIPARRYESADSLAEDIRNYIEGHPVNARRTGARALYELRKFARRHRTGVAAALAAAITLLLVGSFAIFYYRAAAIESRRAEIAAEERLEAMAENQAAAAFAQAFWRHADRHVSFAMSPTQRDEFWSDVLADFERIAKEFGADNPVVRRERARALIQAGDALGGIRSGSRGDAIAARAAYEQARDLLHPLLQEDPENPELRIELAEAQSSVADALRQQNRPTEALAEYARALETLDAAEFPDDDLESARALTVARLSMSQAMADLGRADEARDIFESALRDRRRILAA
ncbi:MAG: serine/threonine-protein kinase, partial [Planctomycetota bacterium]|nr:serine/threonine-protein kinase [Planctomycetota bacterium]